MTLTLTRAVARSACILCKKQFYLTNKFGNSIRTIRCSDVLLGKTPGQLKDKQDAAAKRGQRISKYILMAQGAISAAGGITNVKDNPDLAKILSECQKEGLPSSTVLKAISSDKTLDKEVNYLLTGAENLAVLIGCRVHNPVHAKLTMNAALKLSVFNVKVTDLKLLNKYFERKGVVMVPQPFRDGKSISEEEGMDLAIEVDAEEVIKVDGGVKFVCDPANMKNVVSALEERKIPVSYFSPDFIPLEKIEIPEEELSAYYDFYELLQKKRTNVEKGCEFYQIASNFQSE